MAFTADQRARILGLLEHFKLVWEKMYLQAPYAPRELHILACLTVYATDRKIYSSKTKPADVATSLHYWMDKIRAGEGKRFQYPRDGSDLRQIVAHFRTLDLPDPGSAGSELHAALRHRAATANFEVLYSGSAPTP